MPTVREIKKRIKSVDNIAQITRAMEAVAASRVRRAQARALASRAYSEKAWEILLNVHQMSPTGMVLHPLLAEREEVRSALIVIISADRGLAGAYNANILRAGQRFAERLTVPTRYITIGRKARDAMFRIGAEVIGEFSDLPDEPTLAALAPISQLASEEFLAGRADQVFIAYTDFINILTQRPVVLGWLPLIPYTTEDQVAAEYVKASPAVSGGMSGYEYEPSPEAILNEIVPRFTQLQLYQAALESRASEHAARMVAMRNASDAAGDLTSQLTLVFNKARQAVITSEILDIVGGAEALQETLDALAQQLEKGSQAQTNGVSA